MSAVIHEATDLLALEGFDRASSKIFEGVFELFGTLDTDGQIVDLRGRIFNETTADPKLLVRQHFAECVFWQTSETNVRIVERAVKAASEGEKPVLHLDFRLSADKKRPLELCFEPVETAAGDARIFVHARSSEAVGAEINSFRKQSDQLLLAAEQAAIGLWYWDHIDERLYSTPKCNEIFELAAYEELNYDKVLAVVHPDDRQFVEEFFDETRRTGSKYEEEFRVIYSDGRIEWVKAEGKSYLNDQGQPERMVGVVRRITDEKLAAEELERVYDREKKARDDAEIANRAKDFFLAFVSHELRSPLNAILGWARILQTRPVDDATRKKAYETIEKNANVQTKLINDLVDSTRVATGKIKLEFRPLNIVEVVRSSFETHKPAAETAGLAYFFEFERDQIVVFGDHGRMQQVFSNLLSNAIKYTSSGGTVRVSITSDEETVQIAIEDTGHGIEKRDLPDIFKQFAQGDSERARRSGGLGLGLSIVNILVAKHGGRVAAESEGLGKGARFVVTLPLNATAQDIEVADVTRESDDTRRLNGFNILIVEDDPDSREVLQIFLEQSGASVKTADSARAAMSYFNDPKAKRPDVLISDLAMPEEDGYSLIARIRELPAEKGGQVPALALSAFASAESRQRAFEAGFHRYLTKPFEPGLIVDQVIALRQLNDNPDSN